jgi:RNA polymerase sigma-70 factor (ECF subfamily)
MPATAHETTQIQGCLDRLRAGEAAARDELIACACRRLERLTRKMLGPRDRVHRWEQTDDVLQNASLRLYRALADARPATPADFFRLAAVSIRRELCDLARHYYGPRGQGALHASLAGRLDSSAGDPLAAAAAAEDEDPAHLAAWAEFHAQVERLPQEQRELFDLLWYQELSQAEAAAVLDVSERTLKRRWAAARLRLHEILAKTLPDCRATASF